MKVVRLTLFWTVVLFAIVLTASSFAPFGLSAGIRRGPFTSVTSATVERVLSDRLSGHSEQGSGRAAYTKRLADHLFQLCIEHRLDPAIVLSVIEVESSFRTNAVSSAGAIGLMQLMPQTARVVAHRHPQVRRYGHDLKDPFLNLALGTVYLRELKERYTGLSPYYHLAAYNMGPHRLDTLRARPGFKPEKSLKYFQDVMRGVDNWRHYGFQSIPLALKSKADVIRKTVARNIDSV